MKRTPFTDREIIRGINRRVRADSGLGAADLAFYILEMQRIVRIATSEESMGLGGR
jgi:hypothetical protein